MTATSLAVRHIIKDLSGEPLPSIVLSSHLEAKLASWAIMLHDAGFKICVSPSNPASTVRTEASRLAAAGILVLERDPITSPAADFWARLARFNPQLVFDDGALLINACAERSDLPSLRGAVEFTTSGHDSLSEQRRPAAIPILDVGLSYCKYELGNVYGTGVSALVAICSAANVQLAAKRLLVIGYGAVGRSVASAARAFGANVLVADSKIRHAVRAHFDGHEVGNIDEFVKRADIAVTCSGQESALTFDQLSALPNNALVANVGCFSTEIDVTTLRSRARRCENRGRQIETFLLENGSRIHVLANGELVNLAIGRGWPIELIDLNFALATLCFSEIVTGRFSAGFQPVPLHLEETALSLFMKSR